MGGIWGPLDFEGVPKSYFDLAARHVYKISFVAKLKIIDFEIQNTTNSNNCLVAKSNIINMEMRHRGIVTSMFAIEYSAVIDVSTANRFHCERVAVPIACYASGASRFSSTQKRFSFI